MRPSEPFVDRLVRLNYGGGGCSTQCVVRIPPMELTTPRNPSPPPVTPLVCAEGGNVNPWNIPKLQRRDLQDRFPAYTALAVGELYEHLER